MKVSPIIFLFFFFFADPSLSSCPTYSDCDSVYCSGSTGCSSTNGCGSYTCSDCGVGTVGNCDTSTNTSTNTNTTSIQICPTVTSCSPFPCSCSSSNNCGTYTCSSCSGTGRVDGGSCNTNNNQSTGTNNCDSSMWSQFTSCSDLQKVCSSSQCIAGAQTYGKYSCFTTSCNDGIAHHHLVVKIKSALQQNYQYLSQIYV